ncbi:MAG: hypothetical protein J5750_04450 [Clostridiales bacterium]|nr:hypothetical protein [Clostridiales bacterium]
MDQNLKQQKRMDLAVYIGLAFAAAILTFVACPFSPIFRYCYEPDEICYLVVSRGWLNGKIPYRDLFDHKGPLTYVFYALGLLLSNQASWGIWIVFTGINIGSFLLIYKNIRILFDPYRSWAAISFLFCFFFIKSPALFASGSKPEHIILLFLLLSENIVLKRIREGKKASGRDMLLIGLCAGSVLAIKMNICIYYLCFVGGYFIWLLTRKEWKVFFRNCGAFVGGIGLIVAPIAAYYAASKSLKDLIYAYFEFNMTYARTGGLKLHFSRQWISDHNQIAIFILFCLMVISAFLFLHQKKHRLHNVIIVFLGFVVYFFLTLPEVFAYSFCVMIPLYLLGLGYLADITVAMLPSKKLQVVLSGLLIFVLCCFCLGKLFLHPMLPLKKTELENSMLTYYENHPDSDCLYFTNLCDLFFYDYSTKTPSYKQFYMPREGTGTMYTEQIEYIRQGIPDIVALYRTPDIDDEFMLKLDIFFAENGYSLYFDDSEDTLYYIYVRTET